MSSMPQTLPKREGPRAFSLSKVTAIVREMGWRAAIAGTLLFGWRQWRSWWWDWSHHVTTRHRLPLSKLNLAGPSAGHARFYEASDTKCLPHLLQKLDIPFSESVFIDFGAGKGKAMFLAAGFPFKRIVGVELSPLLSAIAERNGRTFKSKNLACKELEVLCEDAAEFVFPNTPLVIYMFNPFGEEIISRVFISLVESIRRQPRAVLLIYYNPSHRHVIERDGAFELFLEGTDEWDYRKLRYRVYRARDGSPA
jgi:hypothetical protein